MKQKLKTGVPLILAFIKATKAEYSARLQEINAFFQEWAPPPRVRPTSPILLHGMRFGTKKRPPIKVDADSASD